jgi:hypothetical protein
MAKFADDAAFDAELGAALAHLASRLCPPNAGATIDWNFAAEAAAGVSSASASSASASVSASASAASLSLDSVCRPLRALLVLAAQPTMAARIVALPQFDAASLSSSSSSSWHAVSAAKRIGVCEL